MVAEREKAHNRTMNEMKDKLRYLESQYQKSKSEASTQVMKKIKSGV